MRALSSRCAPKSLPWRHYENPIKRSSTFFPLRCSSLSNRKFPAKQKKGLRVPRTLIAGLAITLLSFVSSQSAFAYDTVRHTNQSRQLLTVVPWNLERMLTLRLIFAALVGSAVGWERAASKHSAGIRTMALVSLGAATFTICSMYGFGGVGDPSRMASNVASGVGFLGAGVITTQAYSDDRAGMVSGLTTAAAIWLSAAVGVASGVGMYLIAGTTAALTIGTLRFGREKRKMIKKRIYRHRGTSELHDMSTWDEDIKDDDAKVTVKPKRKKTIIKIARKLPSNKIATKEVSAEELEDNLMAEIMEKGEFAPSKSSRRSTTDDDIQPLP